MCLFVPFPKHDTTFLCLWTLLLLKETADGDDDDDDSVSCLSMIEFLQKVNNGLFSCSTCVWTYFIFSLVHFPAYRERSNIIRLKFLFPRKLNLFCPSAGVLGLGERKTISSLREALWKMWIRDTEGEFCIFSSQFVQSFTLRFVSLIWYLSLFPCLRVSWHDLSHIWCCVELF